MSTTRKIIVDDLRVKDQIQVGDVLVFDGGSGAIAYVQGQANFSDVPSSHATSSHAAVVVGKTFDNIPIISHMLLAGNMTERLDCSKYKYTDFTIHSAKNSIVRMEIAANADTEPQVTKLYEKTTSRNLVENPEGVQINLKQNNRISANGKSLYSNDSGDIQYSQLKILAAMARLMTGLSSETAPDVEEVLESNGIIQVDDATRRIQVNDSQMCISLVMLALGKAEKDTQQDTATQISDQRNINRQALSESWSEKMLTWQLDRNDKQSQELNVSNRTTSLMPAELRMILTNASTIFDTNHTRDLMTLANNPQKIVKIDGQEWHWESGKVGGANVGADAYTGIYVRLGENGKVVERALIKSDWAKGKVRVEKIIGEAVAGEMLDSIYTDVMELGNGDKSDSKSKFAAVKLGRCDGGGLDEDGTNTYVVSSYIPRYKDDLWKYAYREKFKRDISEEVLRKKGLDIHYAMFDILIDKIDKRIEVMMRRYAGMRDDTDHSSKLKSEYMEKIHREIDKINLLNENFENAFIVVTPENKLIINDLIADLAELNVSLMSRPSGAFFAPGSTEARQVVSQFILSDRKLLEDFAKLTAPRLLLGDLGLHNANFGVAEDEHGKPYVVSLDYGAAFLNLIGDFNPFDNSKTGLSFLDKLYKNHFLEYDKEIITSVEMAKAFIQVSNISSDELLTYVAKALSSIDDKYGVTAIKEFCKRLGMDVNGLSSNKDEMILDIGEFMHTRLTERQAALHGIGLNLIIEHCYDPDPDILMANMQQAFIDYPGLSDYMIDEFIAVPAMIYKDENIRNQLLAAAFDVISGLDQFYEAVEIGYYEWVERVVGSKNFNIHLYPGVLQRALENSDIKMVGLLLERGAEIPDDALHLAIDNNSADMVRVLLAAGANIYSKRDGFTALERVERFHYDGIDLYSEIYAQFDAVDHDQINDLMTGALINLPSLVNKAIAAGVDVNALNDDGATALHCAVDYGSVEVVQLLLANGANFNIRNSEGKTPFELARDENSEIILAIFEGRDHPALNNDDNASEVISFGEDDSQLIQAVMDGSIKNVKIQIENGADVNVFTKFDNHTPLILAANNDRWDIVRLLLSAKDVDVNHVNSDGQTILQLAVKAGQLDIVKLILAKKPDLNYENDKGQTVLHFAANLKSEHAGNMVMLLISAGAVPNKKDSSNKTPISYAVTNKLSGDIIRLMQDVKAQPEFKNAGLSRQSIFANNSVNDGNDNRPGATVKRVR